MNTRGDAMYNTFREYEKYINKKIYKLVILNPPCRYAFWFIQLSDREFSKAFKSVREKKYMHQDI